MIKIRPIQRADVDDIIEIIKSAKLDFSWGFYYHVHEFDKEEIWISYRGTSEYPTLVAEYDGKVIAFATNYPHWEEKNNFYIGLLITHANYRGLGAGTKLIKECLKIAVKKGFDVLSLHTWASNRAMRLYQRTGFVWIPGTVVYMINFSPQLFKYEKLKDIFKDPENLINCLIKSPEKVEINGRIAWKYTWRINNTIVEAVFDNDSRSLLSLKLGDDYIEVIPPRKKKYLKGEELKCIVMSSRPRALSLEDKVILLKPGKNEIKIKAKKDVSLRIDEYKFGFKLDVYDPIEIKILPEHIISPAKIDIIITNNKDDKVSGELKIVPVGDLRVEPSGFHVEIPPKKYCIKSVWVEGEGKIKVIFGETDKEVYVFERSVVKIEGDKIISAYWTISNEEIKHAEIQNLGIWYEMRLGNEEIKLKLDARERVFIGKTKRALIRVIPHINGNVLMLEIQLYATRDFSEILHLYHWIDITGESYFILPVNKEFAVKERMLYPAFPKAYSIVRKKLPIPIVGFEFNDMRLLIKYDHDGLYTFSWSPYSFRIDFPINLRRGKRIIKRLSYRIAPVTREFFGRKIVKAIETYTEDRNLAIRNNWVTDITLRIKILNNEFQYKLKSQETIKIPMNLRGLRILNITLDIDGLTEERNILCISPINAKWHEKTLKFKDIELNADERGGSLKSLKFGNKELLAWWDEPKRTPLHIPLTHGGFAILIKIDGKEENVHTKKWEYLGNGEFQTKIDGVLVSRKFKVLDENTIMEEIQATNETNTIRRVSMRHFIIFDEKIEHARKNSLSLHDENVFYIEDKKLVIARVKGEELGVFLNASNNQRISITQLIKFNGCVYSRWTWTIKPGESKIAHVFLSRNTKMLKEVKEFV